MPQKKGGGETPVSKTTAGEDKVASLEDYLKQKAQQNKSEIGIDTPTADKYKTTNPSIPDAYNTKPKREVGGKLNIGEDNL